MKVSIFKVQKFDFEDFYKEEVLKQSKKIIDEVPFNIDFNRSSKILEKGFIKPFNDSILFIISFAMMFIMLNIINSNNLILKVVFIIYYLVGISNVAILYSWYHVKKYPKVKVILNSKKEIDGKLLKIEDDYVNILTHDKIMHINKDSIISIEENRVAPVLNSAFIKKEEDANKNNPEKIQNKK